MAPEPPLLSGDIEQDVAMLRYYVADLAAYIDSTPDAGWSVNVTGLTERRALAASDTLADVINTLATVIGILAQKGFISA